MLEDLKEAVCQANLELVAQGLVVLTWGNASAIDRGRELVVIKPSGVAYDRMTPAHMAVVDLAGQTVEGKLSPSSDTATHLEIYRAWPRIGGIAHTHSIHATMWAQACKPIPCYGTTHADQARGEVPLTRFPTAAEVAKNYEANTGRLIVERFTHLDPAAVPAVLVAGHGPFTWGTDAADAVRNAVVLEAVAEMALGTIRINPEAQPIPGHVLEKHHSRKHGPGAYYGQHRS